MRLAWQLPARLIRVVGLNLADDLNQGMGMGIDDHTLVADHRVCVMLIARDRRQHDRFWNGLAHDNLMAQGHRSRRGLLLNRGYHFLWRRIDCGSDNGASYAAGSCPDFLLRVHAIL